MTWDPAQYEHFRDERSRPFFDLAALVERRPGMKVVDLGCGTGELTRGLHQDLGAVQTVGIDNSPEMLARAATHAAPGLSFRQGDLAQAPPERPFDLIISNAAIQWAGDHPALFPRLTTWLAPGGQLAVQMPANHHHPSHTIAAEVAAESPFRAALGGHVRTSPVLTPEAYARLLDRCGFQDMVVRLQVYAHRLPSRDDVVEWVKGTLLTDYRARMGDEGLYEQFLARYRARLLPLLEDTRPFLYPFARILLWARLPPPAV